jgi:hypothetical protein
VKKPVLVELFTSQGCSSCPPADRILGEILKRDDVVALSFSIDYWDYIGWRDTLARHEHTLRQQAYEKALPSHRVYTPQMVIDGVKDVVGNQHKDVVDAVERRVSETQGKKLPIALSLSGDEAVWAAQPAGANGEFDGTRCVAHGQHHHGREWRAHDHHHNVVRGFAAVDKWSGDARRWNFRRRVPRRPMVLLGSRGLVAGSVWRSSCAGAPFY